MTPKSVKKEGRRCCRHWRRRYPAAGREAHGGADTYAMAHGRPWKSKWMWPEECCMLWRSYAGAGSWQDLWPILAMREEPTADMVICQVHSPELLERGEGRLKLSPRRRGG